MSGASTIRLISLFLSLEMALGDETEKTNGIYKTPKQDAMNCWAYAAANAANIISDKPTAMKDADFIDEAANGTVTKNGGDPEMAKKGLEKMGFKSHITSDQAEAEKAIAAGNPVEVFKNSHAWTNVKGADGKTVRVDSGEGQNRTLEDSEMSEDLSGADSYLIVKKPDPPPTPPPTPPTQGDSPSGHSSDGPSDPWESSTKESRRVAELPPSKAATKTLDGFLPP